MYRLVAIIAVVVVAGLATAAAAAEFSETKLTGPVQAFGRDVAAEDGVIVAASLDPDAPLLVFSSDRAGEYTQSDFVPSVGGLQVLAVDLSDGVIAVGAGGPAGNFVFLYTPDGAGGYTETRIEPPEPNPAFGLNVAIENGTVTVAAPTAGAGVVYVFEPDGVGGYSTVELRPSEAEDETTFGISLDVADGVVVVGVGRTFGPNPSGTPYPWVFFPAAGGGYDEVPLPVPTGGSLGGSLAIRPSPTTPGTVTVATGGTVNADDVSGSLFLYDVDRSGATLATTVSAPDRQERTGFPSSPEFSDDLLVVAAPWDSEANDSAGAVYVYPFVDDVLGAPTKLFASDAGRREAFGRDIAIDGATVVVGVPGDGLDPIPGAVYVYQQVETPPNVSVIGSVTMPDGSPRSDVPVDLFTEGRATFLRSTSTEANGTFGFGVAPGCYVATFIAPDGFVFRSGPDDKSVRFLNQPFCTGTAETFDLGAQQLVTQGGDGSVIEVAVVDNSGTPVPSIDVDLFTATPDRQRGEYLTSVETGPSGQAEFGLEKAGCYIVTYIAPDNETFVESASMWANQHVCVEPGQSKATSATLNRDGPIGDATITGIIADNDSGIAGVTIDLFAASGDGSRGLFLSDTTTDADGNFDFTVKPGCYALVAIAPDGANFPERGRWYETALCVTAGETTRLDIQLDTDSTNPGDCVIGGVPVDTTVTGPECAALVAIFDATGGPEWVDNTGWATPTDPCTWSGITCEDGQVGILFLDANNLVGELPPAIGDLTGLRLLGISRNSPPGPPGFQGDLRGVIPPELGQLRGLERLELSNNRFTGPIPAELGQLSNLQSLSVRRNFQLTGDLPPELGQLTALRNLQLDANQFTGSIPGEYGQLANLEFLDVRGNRLTGSIPPELGDLSNLQILELRDNSLTGTIPPAIGQLSLRFFNISNNMLAGDITEAMNGLRSANPDGISIDIVRSPPANCFSVSDPDLATWIQTRDSDWQQCTP